MSQPYVGEIRLFAGNFAPNGWMFCEGQLLSIAENDVLFNLIGTTYGGDGETTFALPDLRGRVPIHQGSGYSIAQNGGVETATLTTSQIPSHTHPVAATGGGTQPGPGGGLLAAGVAMYTAEAPNNHTLNPVSVQAAGSNQPHTNFQPYLCVSFIISLFGVYPSQN